MHTLAGVAAGFGVTVVPKSLEALRIPNVVYRDIDVEDGFTVPLNVAFRDQALTDSMRKFLAVCDSTAAERA